ncbi:MAG: hypothetical protein J6581_04655 [Apibacter sp.]|jgi:hypothetical protein|uniref:Uncharacterized protein n=1 Tax=Apibacter mensalis TaxID=1586267 RepID=A0A0X3AN47_9FLAO|nr:hypothetical protein [Apibacter mensalis]MCO6564714.1 hypothetical protein [Apibacter sp.]CVK15288.1 hypothetical protein Ga0061079_101100 [Apibacter mensalis]
MIKFILFSMLGLTLLLTSCDKPANGQEVAPTNRYSFQVIVAADGIRTYVFDGKTGDVFVRTSDGKWWNDSGIKTAQKSK